MERRPIVTASASLEKALDTNRANSTCSQPQYRVSVMMETTEDAKLCFLFCVCPDHILTPIATGV